MNIFEEVKKNVTLWSVGSFYGMEVKRQGKHHVCLCPFHKERTPSMVLYADGYKCFGCGESGDAVKLVSKLCNISPLEAVKKIDQDFNIGIIASQLRHQALKRHQDMDEDKALVIGLNKWRWEQYDSLCWAYRAANKAVLTVSIEDKQYKDIIYNEQVIEYMLDILQFGSLKEIAELYCYIERGELNV